MNKRKENDLPLAMIQGEPPARKRSKLILPSPQISDIELEQIVKVGRASESAKEAASETGTRASQTLLNDYAVTNPSIAALRTPRTPAPVTDKILQVISFKLPSSIKSAYVMLNVNFNFTIIGSSKYHGPLKCRNSIERRDEHTSC